MAPPWSGAHAAMRGSVSGPARMPPGICAVPPPGGPPCVPQKEPVVKLTAVAFHPQKKQQKMAQGGPSPELPPGSQGASASAQARRASFVCSGFCCTRSRGQGGGGAQPFVSFALV